MTEKKKIAIVGCGVSGIGALYALRDTGHDVHLYEANDRLGGHTNTLPFEHGGLKVMVDTGFIVMNKATYPNFLPFLKELGIKVVPTAMTFGVSRDQGAFEWSGTSLASIFAQSKNIFRPTFWRMIFDIVRFNQFALDLLNDVDGTLDNDNEMSIGEYLQRERYSDAFRDDYLIPMTACVWSTGADKCALDFPAVTLVRFMWNHHLVSTVAARPDWLTIPGGSKQYIDAVLKDFPTSNIHLSQPIVSARSYGTESRVVLQLGDGSEAEYNEVILACHGDQARRIISTNASPLEMEIMQSFETTPNKVYMHSDVSLLPKREVAWSAWNYLTSSAGRDNDPDQNPSGALQTVSLTYNMNILQHLPVSKFGHVLVTMNPPHKPDSSLTQAEISYRHPLYNAAAVRSQCRLDDIQGKRGIWYCGAWTNYGFHEDGFSSGLAVARRLGGDVPWQVVDAKFVRGRKPVFTWKDHWARLIIMIIQFGILLVGLVASRTMASVRAQRKKLQ